MVGGGKEPICDGVNRIEVRPLALGFRVLFSDSWSIFAHGGVGWYREFFEVTDTPLGPQTGDFARTGWAWASRSRSRPSMAKA